MALAKKFEDDFKRASELYTERTLLADDVQSEQDKKDATTLLWEAKQELSASLRRWQEAYNFYKSDPDLDIVSTKHDLDEERKLTEGYKNQVEHLSDRLSSVKREKYRLEEDIEYLNLCIKDRDKRIQDYEELLEEADQQIIKLQKEKAKIIRCLKKWKDSAIRFYGRVLVLEEKNKHLGWQGRR